MLRLLKSHQTVYQFCELVLVFASDGVTDTAAATANCFKVINSGIRRELFTAFSTKFKVSKTVKNERFLHIRNLRFVTMWHGIISKDGHVIPNLDGKFPIFVPQRWCKRPAHISRVSILKRANEDTSA